MIVDTHCHLNTESFEADLDMVIKHAKEKTVTKMIVIGMYEKANEQAIALANTYEGLYATVGLHPSHVDEAFDEAKLMTQLKEPKVVAIGEIGIDLYWVKDNLDRQIEVFKQQLDLAIKLDKPVVIHLRNSAQEIYDVLKHYKDLRGVMHCFSESLDWALKFIELGLYIGIGGPVTFKNNSITKAVVQGIPLDKIILETDSPYLAPTPNRGKRNEPANTYYVAQEVAKLTNKTLEEVAELTTSNAKRLFHL